jgi:hypothetical protein
MKPIGYILVADHHHESSAMQDIDDHTHKLAGNERRGIWLALVVVLVLAATLVLGSDTRRALLRALAIGIVFAVIWLGQQRSRGTKSATRAIREVVMHDEWRQVAIGKAYKWAFFAVLGALAMFCLLSTVMTIVLSGQMMAALTVALGVSVFLAVFLLYDRE